MGFMAVFDALLVEVFYDALPRCSNTASSVWLSDMPHKRGQSIIGQSFMHQTDHTRNFAS